MRVTLRLKNARCVRLPLLSSKKSWRPGETDKPAKKGLNTDGNTYTIIYSCVVVVIVAFLLAFVSKALEPQSMANVRIDKKSQILAALNLRDVEKAEVEKTYDEVVVADEIIDKDGNVVKDGTSKDADGFAVEDKNISDSNLPLYVCKVNGETKYVIPVTGKGCGMRFGDMWL